MNFEQLLAAAQDFTVPFTTDNLLKLTETKTVILFLAMSVEMLLPLPRCCRLDVLLPIFRTMGRKVNLESNSPSQRYFAGIMTTLMLCAAVAGAVILVHSVAGFDSLIVLLLLPFVLESRECSRHTSSVCKLLKQGDKEQARQELSEVMLRECDRLSPMGCAKAASDYACIFMFKRWFCVMFWFLAAGIEGAVMMQLFNIISGEFSVKLERNSTFGLFPARCCELACLIPALLLGTLISFTWAPLRGLKGGIAGCKCYPSPSCGFMLGSCGAVLNLSLGGPRYYEGSKCRYPRVGGTNDPAAASPMKILHRIRFWGILLVGLGVLAEIHLLR